MREGSSILGRSVLYINVASRRGGPGERTGVCMEREEALRQEICQVCHLLYERGYVVSNDGNVSVRLGEDRLLITPSGVGKGRMTPEMLVVCDLEGNVPIRPWLRPSPSAAGPCGSGIWRR